MLCSEPKTITEGFCNTLLGSFKVTYISNRRIRRLESGDNAVIGTLDEVMKNFPEAVTSNVDGVNGIFIRNIASDMDSLSDIAVGDVPASSEGTDNNSGGQDVTKIVVPVVVCVLLVGFIIGAYVIHRRRQNQIIVELEETMDSQEEYFMSSPLKLRGRKSPKVVQTEQLFPIDSGEDSNDSNYLPGFDCVCGGNQTSSSST